MSETTRAPEASMLRLSRYHCFLGELIGTEGAAARITSRRIADELGLAEETVRRDLSYVELDGRPGAGYDPAETYEALESYLGLSRSFPFAAIGDRTMLAALSLVFPAEQFGLEPAAYYSADPADAGTAVDGLTILGLEEIPATIRESGATVALVACAPEGVASVLDLLDEAGVRSVLMLTPMLRPKHPDGMNVTYFRIPCAMKALAATAPRTDTSCCSGKAGCCGGAPGASD